MSYDLFSTEERAAAFKTKRRLLILYFSILGVVVAAITLMAVFNLLDVLGTGSRRLKAPFMAGGIVIAIAFSAFSLFFFSIKFRLTRKYVRMLKDIDSGLKDETVGKLIGFDESVSEKDGVFFYGMLTECTPLKRGDIIERKVLIERNIEKPDLNPGDKIRFITHANILISYEIIKRAEVKKEETEGAL